MLQPSETILQLLVSIRNLDGRISELKNGIIFDRYTLEAKKIMKQRVERLVVTRMNLVYSLMDKKLDFDRYVGKETQFFYENLKREIEGK